MNVDIFTTFWWKIKFVVFRNEHMDKQVKKCCNCGAKIPDYVDRCPECGVKQMNHVHKGSEHEAFGDVLHIDRGEYILLKRIYF